MKSSFAVCVLIFLLSINFVSAANYGKFKFVSDTGLYDASTATFLLNTSGDVKFLDNNDYIEVKSQDFFGETTLNFETGGDEDYVIARAVLKNNKVVEYCAAGVDGPGGLVYLLSSQSVGLSRWSKSSNKYYLLDSATNKQACQKKLLEDYSDFDVTEY